MSTSNARNLIKAALLCVSEVLRNGEPRGMPLTVWWPESFAPQMYQYIHQGWKGVDRRKGGGGDARDEG